MHYAAGAASTVFQMEMGMVDRGADISWLSQYPHEKEVLFPPLTGVQVLGMHVDGSTLVVEARLSLNLTAPTIEQVDRCEQHRGTHHGGTPRSLPVAPSPVHPFTSRRPPEQVLSRLKHSHLELLELLVDSLRFEGAPGAARRSQPRHARAPPPHTRGRRC